MVRQYFSKNCRLTVDAKGNRLSAQRHRNRRLQKFKVAIRERNNISRHGWGRFELGNLPLLILSRRNNVGKIGRGVHTRLKGLFVNSGHVAQIDSIRSRDQGNGERRFEKGLVPARECASSIGSLQNIVLGSEALYRQIQAVPQTE